MPDEKFRELFDKVGLGFIEAHITSSKATALGVNAVLTSIVVESWTAFETLAAERWATSLDNDTSGTLSGNVDSSGALRTGRKLTKTTFNLKSHPGSYSLETR